MVVDGGDDGRDEDTCGDSSGGERADRLQALLRPGCARLEDSGEARIQGRDRERYGRGALSGQITQDVGVTSDKGVLCRNRDRVSEFREDLQASSVSIRFLSIG